ncbi:glycosyltransferase family 2 protein [Bifidobacterium pseudolongum]|uniref:glycosyltransferase family 2 protein n=2 Tax=Bifidobacterium pseudolongum TaxID=1694 RepID=UPI001F5CA524|nr:glycosyltransferase family 2 protein [Bifidobacterium pseudolongum]
MKPQPPVTMMFLGSNASVISASLASGRYRYERCYPHTVVGSESCRSIVGTTIHRRKERIHATRHEILMATYNGAEYIEQQIASIQQQTLRNWTLSISDDCSTDDTLDIITRLARQDARIRIVSHDVHHGSPQANFNALMAQASGRYVFLADQDDLWHADKLALFMQRLHSTEAQYGSDTPLLAFSDLMVVDAHNDVIAPSFLRFIGRDPHRTQLNELLAQNLVTGCATAMNAALRDVIRSIVTHSDGDHMVMHDWCYALVAAALGHVVYVNQATVNYRQHGDNAMGAHRYSALKTLMSLIVHRAPIRRQRVARMHRMIAQAAYVRDALAAYDRPSSLETLDAYCAHIGCTECGICRP